MQNWKAELSTVSYVLKKRERRKQAEDQIQKLAQDPKVFTLGSLYLDEYTPGERELALVVRNHTSPYELRTLTGMTVYGEFNGHIARGSLVTVNIADIRFTDDGKEYGSGKIVGVHSGF